MVKQRHTRYEYGASIYRKIGPGNTLLGYYYGVIEEGPQPPTQQEVISGRKTSSVKIPSGGPIHDLAGTIHSHPYDRGTTEDRDHQYQLDLIANRRSPFSPGGAFSYGEETTDIEMNIKDQFDADFQNPLPAEAPQEHYVMTAGKHLWYYTPERPVISNYNVDPKRALQPRLFHYGGHIDD